MVTFNWITSSIKQSSVQCQLWPDLPKRVYLHIKFDIFKVIKLCHFKFVTGTAKSTMSTQKLPVVLSLLYYNLITFYTNTTDRNTKFNGFPLAIYRTGYCIPDIIKTITWCNLCSHCLFCRPSYILCFIDKLFRKQIIFVAGFEKSHLPRTIINI